MIFYNTWRPLLFVLLSQVWSPVWNYPSRLPASKPQKSTSAFPESGWGLQVCTTMPWWSFYLPVLFLFFYEHSVGSNSGPVLASQTFYWQIYLPCSLFLCFLFFHLRLFVFFLLLSLFLLLWYLRALPLRSHLNCITTQRPLTQNIIILRARTP